LDDQQCLTPQADAARQEHEERAVSWCAARAFDAALEDKELVTQQGVLGHEGRFAPWKVSECPQYENRADRLGGYGHVVAQR